MRYFVTGLPKRACIQYVYRLDKKRYGGGFILYIRIKWVGEEFILPSFTIVGRKIVNRLFII